MSEHVHEHTHDHSHDHSGEHSPEEALALLTYMCGHNKHHTEELHELAHDLTGDAAELLHEAVKDFSAGTEKLEKVLIMLGGGK